MSDTTEESQRTNACPQKNGLTRKGRPDPEIFIKTAEALEVPVENCIVFEDSAAGVQPAKAGGIKVAALTTTQAKADLKEADLVIKDYTCISFKSS